MPKLLESIDFNILVKPIGFSINTVGFEFHSFFIIRDNFSMTGFGLSTIGQVSLTVRNPAVSVEFYRDKLGLELLVHAYKMAFFDCGGIRLTLMPGEGGASTSTVYFKVDDIAGAVETLSRRGVEFDRGPHLVAKMPDHELWMAFFRDPDGNALGLMCEKSIN